MKVVVTQSKYTNAQQEKTERTRVTDPKAAQLPAEQDGFTKRFLSLVSLLESIPAERYPEIEMLICTQTARNEASILPLMSPSVDFSYEESIVKISDYFTHQQEAEKILRHAELSLTQDYKEQAETALREKAEEMVISCAPYMGKKNELDSFFNWCYEKNHFAEAQKELLRKVLLCLSWVTEANDYLSNQRTPSWRSNNRTLEYGQLDASFSAKKQAFVVFVPYESSIKDIPSLFSLWDSIQNAGKAIEAVCKPDLEYKITINQDDTVKLRLMDETIKVDRKFNKIEDIQDAVLQKMKSELVAAQENEAAICGKKVAPLPFAGDGLAHAIAVYIQKNNGENIFPNICVDRLKGHIFYVAETVVTQYDEKFEYETRDDILQMLVLMGKHGVIKMRMTDGYLGEYNTLSATPLTRLFIRYGKSSHTEDFAEDSTDMDLYHAITTGEPTQLSDEIMLNHAMVLLNHPRVFELDPEAYVAYLRLCPPQIKAYIETLKQLADETYKKRIYRAVLTRL